MSGGGRTEPPSGQPPPTSATIGDGPALDLAALAREICRRYRDEYPDEQERYGDAGRDWCVHDNQHLVNWAVLDTREYVSLEDQVSWLAKVLEAREFPLDRLARDLDIAADVVGERVPGGGPVAAALTRAGAMVRSRPTFL